MTKHLTLFEGGAGDVAKRLEAQSDRSPAASERGPVAWRDLLGDVIEREVLPRMTGHQAGFVDDQEPVAHGGLDGAAIAVFVGLIVDDDVEQLRAMADRVVLYTGSRDAMLTGLLAPAARLLGRMWEQDACDFMTVTLGTYRLNQLMRETEAWVGTGAGETPFPHGNDRSILLLPAPGEQHSFGVSMVADAFRADGWCVRCAPAVSRSQLQRLVKQEWFDVIGLSVSTERFLKGLPACIRAVRAASCNQRSFVMLGGHAVICQPERARFMGVDCVAEDAGKAVRAANKYMETAVTERFCQFITKPIDKGHAL
jgi:methanogenic corrinoid protein MtbC1